MEGLNLPPEALAQLLNFLPTMQALQQQYSTNQTGMTTPAIQTAMAPATPAATAPPQPPPTQPQVFAAPPATQAPQQPVAASSSSTSGGSLFSFPSISQASGSGNPVLSSTPIPQYTSFQMLNAVTNPSGPGSSALPRVYTDGSPSSEGHPNLSTVSGFPSLIQRANQARQNHAAASLPAISKKKRGKSQRPPSLADGTPRITMQDCVIRSPAGEELVNMELFVYPPQPPNYVIRDNDLPRQVMCYTRQRDSFQTVLQNLGLYYRCDNVPLSRSVVQVLNDIADRMRQHGYDLPVQMSQSAFAAHESLPLQMLGFSNLGRPNGAHRTPRFVTASTPSTLTVRDILYNSREFGIPRWAVASDRRFILNLRSANIVKTHRCLSTRIYGLFRHDVDARINNGFSPDEELDLEMDCVENEQEEGESSDTEIESVASVLVRNDSMVVHAPQSPPAATPPPASSSPLPPSSPPLSTPSSPSSAPSASSSHTANQDIARYGEISPERLWGARFEEEHLLGIPTIYSYHRTKRTFEVVGDRYREKHYSDCPILRIEGATNEEAVARLKSVVIDCINKQDFTRLLAPTRIFLLLDTEGETVTSGPGFEWEITHLFFKQYFQDAKAKFFAPLGETYSTLATVPLATARWMSEEQRMELSVLGAVVALALVYGYSTAPLNPLLLIYLINDQDLTALRPTIVNHWAPDLYVTLKAWNAISSVDNIDRFAGHFATYHDIQTSALQSRSSEMHKVLGWEMLHAAVVGPQPGVKHPFWQAFLRGFNMPCKRGFSFTQRKLARAYVTGSTTFVGSVYAGHITNYDSLRLSFDPELEVTTENLLHERLAHWATLPDSFPDMFREFLEGTGAPCPELLNSIKDRFHPVVDLSDINSSTFRMRMFCWATTGTPTVILDGSAITVILIDDDDEVYAAGIPENQRQVHLQAGICKYRTCSRYVRIPVSYLNRIIEPVSDGTRGPVDVKTAIHHWLLTSILDNVGVMTVA
ncbi:hypothetical protein V5O48_002299 [Marasmius crinis-equi]|uniref:Uncharacterized protein n=1 Tax=Marasmius crinis-equi TaxID=585013 RepID=A0ABR3FW37_9AGAR